MTPESTSSITTTLSPVIETTIAEIPEDTVYDISDVESTINGIPEQTIYTDTSNPTTNEELLEQTIDEIPESTVGDIGSESTVAAIPENTNYLPKTANNTVLVDNFNNIIELTDNAKLIRQNILDGISNKTITLDGLVTYFKINKPSVYSEAINKISENYANLILNDNTNTYTIEKIENEMFGTTITVIDFEKVLNQNETFTFYTDIDDVKYTIYINGIKTRNGILRIAKDITVPFVNNESLECCIKFEKEDYMPCSVILNAFSLQNRNININLQELQSVLISASATNEQNLVIDNKGSKFKIFKNLIKHNGTTYTEDFYVKYVLYDTNNTNNNSTTLPGHLIDVLDNNIKLQALLYVEFVGKDGTPLYVETSTSTFNEYTVSVNVDSADVVNIYEIDYKYGKFKDTNIDTNKTTLNNIYTYQVQSNKSTVILFGTIVTNARSCKIRFLNKQSLIGKQIFTFNHKGFNPYNAKCFDTVFNIPVTTNKFIINNNISTDNNEIEYDIELNLLKNEKNSIEYLTIDFSTLFENVYTLKLNLLNADKLTNFPDTDRILFNCDLKDSFIFSPDIITELNLKLKEIYTAPLNDIIYKGNIENLKINGTDITGNVIFTEFLDLKNSLLHMSYMNTELKLYYNNKLIGSTSQECITSLLDIFNDTIDNTFKLCVEYNNIEYYLTTYNSKMWFGDNLGNIISEADLKNVNNITLRYNYVDGNFSLFNIPLITD